MLPGNIAAASLITIIYTLTVLRKNMLYSLIYTKVSDIIIGKREFKKYKIFKYIRFYFKTLPENSIQIETFKLIVTSMVILILFKNFMIG